MATADLSDIKKAFRVSTEVESFRAGRILLVIRMIIASLWTLSYLGYYLFLQERLENVLSLLSFYLIISVLFYIAIKPSESLLRKSKYLCIFFDMPFIFYIQYVTMQQQIWSQYLVVSFTMMMGIIFILLSQFLFSRKMLILATVMGTILSMAFFSAIGLSTGWPSVFLIFAMTGWIVVYFQKRLFSILNQVLEVTFKQKRIEQDLALAREIQRKFLPASAPPGFPVHALNHSYYEVSGDFYDYFTLKSGNIYFCIADVCGKGLNAALLMAKTSSLFHCLGKTIDSPGELLSLINNELIENNNKSKFVTMVAGYYSPQTHIIKFANAGHHYPIIFNEDNTIEKLTKSSLPLGIIPHVTYPEVSVNIQNRTFYVVTDGLIEMSSKQGEMIPEDFVIDLFRQNRNTPLEQRLEQIINNALEHMWEIKDDITMLVVEENKDPSANENQYDDAQTSENSAV